MESPLLNIDQLDSLTVLGPDDFLELLGDVVQDVPGYLENIHSAIRDNNLVELKSCSHSMRGMLANFGCIGMTAYLHQLEYERVVTPDLADSTHAELQDLWDRSMAAIKEWEKTVPDFVR